MLTTAGAGITHATGVGDSAFAGAATSSVVAGGGESIVTGAGAAGNPAPGVLNTYSLARSLSLTLSIT